MNQPSLKNPQRAKLQIYNEPKDFLNTKPETNCYENIVN